MDLKFEDKSKDSLNFVWSQPQTPSLFDPFLFFISKTSSTTNALSLYTFLIISWLWLRSCWKLSFFFIKSIFKIERKNTFRVDLWIMEYFKVAFISNEEVQLLQEFYLPLKSLFTTEPFRCNNLSRVGVFAFITRINCSESLR